MSHTTDDDQGRRGPRPGQTVRFQEREWLVTAMDSTPWAARVGGQFVAHTRFVTLMSIAAPAAEITLPESEWRLLV